MHGPGKLRSAFLPKNESSAWASQNRPELRSVEVRSSLLSELAKGSTDFQGLCWAVTQA